MSGNRYLIVNADDFGLSPGVNRGIIEAHEHGIVTSASLMVRWPSAVEAASYARNRPALSIGLHVDLGEWLFRDSAWTPVYEVVPNDDANAVANEVTRQLAEFRRLMGMEPTHLDSHQHVHRNDPVRTVLKMIASELAIPVRHFTPEVRYNGQFYGQTSTGSPNRQAITVEGLTAIFAELQPGLTELACHPGDEATLVSAYSRERMQEVKALCDPQVRLALIREGIQLRSFGSASKS